MLANCVSYFTESVISVMTHHANQHGAINLAQGMPDFDTPELKDAAARAIQDGYNPHAIAWGAPPSGILEINRSGSGAARP